MKNTFLITTLLATTSLATNAWADDINCYDCMTANNCPENSGCVRNTRGNPTSYYKIENGNLTLYGPSASDQSTQFSKWAFSTGSGVSDQLLPSTVTSITVSGNISMIQDSAFSGAKGLTSVDLRGVQTVDSDCFSATSVTDANLTGVRRVGGNAFTSLKNVDLTGVSWVEPYAFKSSSLTRVILPNSFFNEDGNLKDTISDTAFYYSGLNTIYCPQGKNCTGILGQYGLEVSNIITYTQDDAGVYTVGTKIYASALDLSKDIECSTGLQDCQIKALAYQGDKCKTNTECGNLIDMVEDSNYNCDSIAACSAYAKANNLSLANLSGGSGGNSGSSTGSGKRIYTVEEARQAVEAAGTETVNFRIRYK